MRIADSQIEMAAGRRYVQQGKNTGFLQESEDTFSQITKRMGETVKAMEEDAASSGDGLIGLRNSLLQELMQRMMKAGMGSFMGSKAMTGFSGMGTSPGAQVVTSKQMQYYEEETTSFSAKGIAKTQDGRQIDFSVDILMSRAFTQYTEIRIPTFTGTLLDPLVVHVGANTGNISDQKFTFDLDADGSKEEISMPGKGSGFLALDHNGDGVINDGSELFGTRSGNGFEDLKAYDGDGNGWIDENDDIFSKLRVWYKNAEGEDELVDLKTADIGAIYLGHQKTDFSLFGAGMGLNGVVRATGFFLRESGMAGTIQHIDLAATKTTKQEGADGALSGGTPAFVGGEGAGLSALTVAAKGVSGQAAGDEGSASVETETAARNTSQEPAAKTRRQQEADRRETARKRREEELNKKVANERFQERRALRRAQIEKLFEERAIVKQELEEAFAEKQAEQAALREALQTEAAEGAVLQEQLAAIA